MLSTLAYEVTTDVLEVVRTVMAAVRPDSYDLIDLYHARGNADPILIAMALDAMAKSRETLFEEDWRIVTDDDGVKDKAAELGVRTISANELRQQIGDESA
jgi:hypothetical protein